MNNSHTPPWVALCGSHLALHFHNDELGEWTVPIGERAYMELIAGFLL